MIRAIKFHGCEIGVLFNSHQGEGKSVNETGQMQFHLGLDLFSTKAPSQFSVQSRV